MGPGEYTDPIAIAVAPDGTLWVLDDVRMVAEHYDRTGDVLGSFDPFKNVPTTKGANTMAIGPNGHVYVTQLEPNQIAEFDADGTFIQAFGQADFLFDQPSDLAIDAEGRTFVTRGAGFAGLPGVTVFGADGTRLGGLEAVDAGEPPMRFPAGIALDGTGSLYVMDSDPRSARLVKVALAPPFTP
jgi:sugar lactone lactonase YvrE